MTGSRTDKRERLLLLFKKAIEGEREAQELYAEMSSACEDPDLKRVIESFRAAEQRHEVELMDKYAALRKSEKFRE